MVRHFLSHSAGVPGFDPAEIPLRADRRRDSYAIALPESRIEIFALSMGNPHAVLLVNDVDAAVTVDRRPSSS